MQEIHQFQLFHCEYLFFIGVYNTSLLIISTLLMIYQNFHCANIVWQHQPYNVIEISTYLVRKYCEIVCIWFSPHHPALIKQISKKIICRLFGNGSHLTYYILPTNIKNIKLLKRKQTQTNIHKSPVCFSAMLSIHSYVPAKINSSIRDPSPPAGYLSIGCSHTADSLWLASGISRWVSMA